MLRLWVCRRERFVHPSTTCCRVPYYVGHSVRNFLCRYLERIGFKDYAAKVCFVTPDVTQFVKLHEGEHGGERTR